MTLTQRHSVYCGCRKGGQQSDDSERSEQTNRSEHPDPAVLRQNRPAATGGKIAVSVYDAKSLEGYQIKGAAEYVTEGEVVKTFKAMVEQMFNGGATAKGALIITPEKVIVTTPGADNKKEL